MLDHEVVIGRTREDPEHGELAAHVRRERRPDAMVAGEQDAVLVPAGPEQAGEPVDLVIYIT